MTRDVAAAADPSLVYGFSVSSMFLVSSQQSQILRFAEVSKIAKHRALAPMFTQTKTPKWPWFGTE